MYRLDRRDVGEAKLVWQEGFHLDAEVAEARGKRSGEGE